MIADIARILIYTFLIIVGLALLVAKPFALGIMIYGLVYGNVGALATGWAALVLFLLLDIVRNTRVKIGKSKFERWLDA